MLTYFPSPHPGEWWYSVLCRYHVRSGNSKHRTSIKELFGGHPKVAMGTLFPNGSIYQVVSQLPKSWKCQNMILKHTLFSYYVRMYSTEQKRKMMDALCSGDSVILTHIWRSTTKKTWSLKYCPICAQEDTVKYGEPYWHREHQLPLASVCCVHHCRLQCAGEPNPRLNEVFYPLNIAVDKLSETDNSISQWEEELSAILTDYLILPLEVGPASDHNNLALALATKVMALSGAVKDFHWMRQSFIEI